MSVFDDPLIGISGVVFAVVMVVLIDNLIERWKNSRGGDDS